jgi:hypothetical protein
MHTQRNFSGSISDSGQQADIVGSLRLLLIFAAFAVLSGCEQRAPLVYVLESPQSVELTASASASTVQQNETVTLRVQRRTSGTWKQIPRDTLRPGQCWVYRPPAAAETEVADNVQWEVVPEDSVRFNGEFRMDHTKIATMRHKGRIRLTPISSITCEPDRTVRGPPIEIEVS